MNSYWNKHLKEHQIDIVDYKKELIIGELSCIKMKYKSFDGSIITCKLVVPKKSNNKILLNIHGLGTRLTDYYDVIPFGLLGYTVATIDIRSQGGESLDISVYTGDTKRSFIARGVENDGENLYYKNVLLDHYYLCDWLKDNKCTPNCDTIDLFGGSQGGGLGLMVAALRNDISKAIISYPYLTDIWTGLYLSSDVYSELSKYFKHSDPLGLKAVEYKKVIGNIDPINFADEIQCEILYAISHLDQSIPVICQQNMYEKLKCDKHLLTYMHHGHEKLPELMDRALIFLN